MAKWNDWYNTAFNQRYIQLYAQRDESECKSLYQTLSGRGLVPCTGVILDAACGTGRWLRVLRSHSVRAVGFDRSLHQLEAAKENSVVRADLLHFPVRDAGVDAVCSIFSSFGYFETVELDRKQLAEAARVLIPGGWFLLDTAPVRTLETLVPGDSFRFDDGVEATIRRSRAGNCAVKTIELSNGDSWQERLRMYAHEELDEMASSVGLQLKWRIGDYFGTQFSEEQSPRMIGCYVRTH